MQIKKKLWVAVEFCTLLGEDIEFLFILAQYTFWVKFIVGLDRLRDIQGWQNTFIFSATTIFLVNSSSWNLRYNLLE